MLFSHLEIFAPNLSRSQGPKLAREHLEELIKELKFSKRLRPADFEILTIQLREGEAGSGSVHVSSSRNVALREAEDGIPNLGSKEAEDWSRRLERIANSVRTLLEEEDLAVLPKLGVLAACFC